MEVHPCTRNFSVCTVFHMDTNQLPGKLVFGEDVMTVVIEERQHNQLKSMLLLN